MAPDNMDKARRIIHALAGHLDGAIKAGHRNTTATFCVKDAHDFLVRTTAHFVSGSCAGEVCRRCSEPATHKLGEEIPHDDPLPSRHNLTAYVCCIHFVEIVGTTGHAGYQQPEGAAT